MTSKSAPEKICVEEAGVAERQLRWARQSILRWVSAEASSMPAVAGLRTAASNPQWRVSDATVGDVHERCELQARARQRAAVAVHGLHGALTA